MTGDLAAYARDARDWLAHPALAWSLVPYARGRGAIFKALRIDRSEPLAGYATSAFKILSTAEDETWIAGAIGASPSFNVSAVLDWSHLDIRDVILWNPRTGALRLLGQVGPALVIPDEPGGRLTIYGDGFAFFRAWADRRAETGARIKTALGSVHGIVPVEPADSDLPGALVIGDIAALRWSHMGVDGGVDTLVAGPGVDAAALKRAIFRAARLPRIESSDLRRAA